MTTRTPSSARSSARLLLGLPILLSFALCSATPGYAQSPRFKRGNIITFRDNQFELGNLTSEPVQVKEKRKKAQPVSVSINPFPVKMNGNQIYSDSKVTTKASYAGDGGSFEKKVFEEMRGTFSKLDNGTYQVWTNNLIVDEHGKLVYYEIGGLQKQGAVAKETEEKPVPVMPGIIINGPKTQETRPTPVDVEVRRKLAVFLETDMPFKAATLKGEPVISTVDLDLVWKHKIEVKDHQARLL